MREHLPKCHTLNGALRAQEMGKPFSQELDRIGQTLDWCQSVLHIQRHEVYGRGSELLVCVGSGGSSSAAEFAARAAQIHLRRNAIALTPLDYVQRVEALGKHRALLLSAEGKNSDIRMAATTAVEFAEHTSALSFRSASPLLELLQESDRSSVIAIDAPWDKDGYLATNSLIAMQVLLAQAAGLSVDASRALDAFGSHRRMLPSHAAVLAGSTRLLALHGAVGAVPAIDLESKFAESAFATVQRADLRQFAHGRHLQLASGRESIPVVAFIGDEDLDLWVETRALLPSTVQLLQCPLPGGLAQATLHGLLFAFALVEAVARPLGVDPGAPNVPLFARQIHALEAGRHLPQAPANRNAKLALLRRTGTTFNAITTACDAYLERLSQAKVKGIVLDFDGTCCETARRFEGMDSQVQRELQRLLDSGLQFAFASGRGDSLHSDLRARFEAKVWPQVHLGCHSGSSQVSLAEAWREAPVNEAFGILALDLARRGISQTNRYRIRAKAEQFTIECVDAALTSEVFLIASELAAVRQGWRAFRSSHSVDLLTERAGKSLVVSCLAQRLAADAETAILRIGDRGELHGNDYELLYRGLSLSVDGVNAESTSCWIFGASSENPLQRALAYLRALVPTSDGVCRFSPEATRGWQQSMQREVVAQRERNE